jgi:hypothetical protein
MRKQHAEAYALTQKNIEKIKKIAIKKIAYPELKEAYEYVDDLFPDAHVKDVIIHKVAAKDLAKMGFRGVEGFYDPVTKIVVISGAHKSSYYGDPFYKVEAKVEKDEVIVHELCHYCYVFMGHRSVSSEMREEFAYGYSVGYLRKKGYSDEYIIKYNFLPYLMGIFNEQATTKIFARNGITIAQYNSFSNYKRKECNRMYRKKIFLLSKEMAMKRGQDLIDMYTIKLEEGGYTESKGDNEYGRYGMLDL